MPQVGSTQDVVGYVEKDIVEFLSEKYIVDATLSILELTQWYSITPDRAQRVLQNLTARRYVRPTKDGNYRVIV